MFLSNTRVVGMHVYLLASRSSLQEKLCFMSMSHLVEVGHAPTTGETEHSEFVTFSLQSRVGCEEEGLVGSRSPFPNLQNTNFFFVPPSMH